MQIPHFVLEAVDLEILDKCRKFMIGCTQPHRVAAMSVSRQVAEEMDVFNRWYAFRRSYGRSTFGKVQSDNS